MEDDIFLKTKIRVQFQSLKGFPSILQANPGGVFINRCAPYPDEMEYIEAENVENLYNKDLIKIEKLIFKNCDRKKLNISMIKSEYFDDRDMFDNLIADKEITQESISDVKETISFREALTNLDIDIAANMDYYLLPEHSKELNDYFGKEINTATNLESELFEKLMAKLFGFNAMEKENINILKDFRIICNRNCSIATAKNEKYYLAFYVIKF